MGGEEERDGFKPGDIVTASRQRPEIFYQHTPLADPVNCGAAGAHICYAESHSPYRNQLSVIEPDMLRVHHYVEMLPQHRGRCAGQHGSCDTLDDSALWL